MAIICAIQPKIEPLWVPSNGGVESILVDGREEATEGHLADAPSGVVKIVALAGVGSEWDLEGFSGIWGELEGI